LLFVPCYVGNIVILSPLRVVPVKAKALRALLMSETLAKFIKFTPRLEFLTQTTNL